MSNKIIDCITKYGKDHPEVDINIIIPNENNIKRVLEVLKV